MDETRIVKMVKRPAKSKPPKNRSIYDEVNLSSWNPFERIDPKILECLHKKHEATARRFILDDTEEAPF